VKKYDILIYNFNVKDRKIDWGAKIVLAFFFVVAINQICPQIHFDAQK